MSEVVVFLASQPLFIRAAVYVASLVCLSAGGGLALSLVIAALDAAGGALTANRDWDVVSRLSTKEDTLQLFAVAAYSALLLSVEPSVRALASSVGSALVASLILAPIAGLIMLGMRKPA